jgi:3-methyladenine DNA glycosylase AlkD
MSVECDKIVQLLKQQKNYENIAGMAKYGISTNNTFGVPVPVLRNIAKEAEKNHLLALELWDTGIHEARIIAGLVADVDLLTEDQMEHWVKDLDSWDVCDQVCNNLFSKSKLAKKKIKEWVKSEEEYVKRAGFVLIASLAVHDKEMSDDQFVSYLKLIKKESKDNRNFVKKAINWALRQIGKRNEVLKVRAIETANEILLFDAMSAKWIASDALRELKK